MTEIHRYIAYSIPAAFALLLLWTIYIFVRNRPPHDWYWSLLALVQIVLGVQVVVGGILFVAGSRPLSNGPQWLHYVYGGLFPVAVLLAAHLTARRERFETIPWVPFGLAALVNFGLTFRALQTGLGID